MTASIGEKIRALRSEKGYTLDELARLAESSKSYIWELEKQEPAKTFGREAGEDRQCTESIDGVFH